LERLNRGLEVEHTSISEYDELRLALILADGAETDLVWPDYGGEQINTLMQERRVSPEWEGRVQAAKGWLVFLRPDRIDDAGDIVHRPIEALLKRASPSTSSPVQWSEQAKTIELIQLLLSARNADLLQRVKTPAVGIILTCWDELDAESRSRQPRDVLRIKMPLLVDFLEANWVSESYFFTGLSSTEFPLNVTQPNEQFVENGPEAFGYVMLEDGTKSTDLSLPVVELLRRS
jgi:hypothetical protein